MTGIDKLKSREDFLALCDACKAALDRENIKILVCGGTGCVAGGSLQIFDRLKALLEERGLNVEVELAHEPHGELHGETIGMKKSGSGFARSAGLSCLCWRSRSRYIQGYSKKTP